MKFVEWTQPLLDSLVDDSVLVHRNHFQYFFFNIPPNHTIDAFFVLDFFGYKKDAVLTIFWTHTSIFCQNAKKKKMHQHTSQQLCCNTPTNWQHFAHSVPWKSEKEALNRVVSSAIWAKQNQKALYGLCGPFQASDAFLESEHQMHSRKKRSSLKSATPVAEDANGLTKYSILSILSIQNSLFGIQSLDVRFCVKIVQYCALLFYHQVCMLIRMFDQMFALLEEEFGTQTFIRRT